jgi:hypothetical protein
MKIYVKKYWNIKKMYDIKFSLGDKVNIIPLHKELEGVVISIWIVNVGVKYEIRYFWENKANEVYFYDWELEKI